MKLIDRCITCKHADLGLEVPNIIDSKIIAWCNYSGKRYTPCTNYIIEEPEVFGCIHWKGKIKCT